MAEKRPTVWRNLLIVALAVFVLIAVASVSFKLGVRHAGDFNPAMVRFEQNESYRQFDNGRGHMGGMFGARLAILLIGATLLGMLVLGTVAFFRTGGWQPAATNVTQTTRRKRS